MKQWNEIFKQSGKVFLEPHENIAKVVEVFKKHKVKRVLDLGSGSGRHVIYLVKNGFDVYGFDIAEEGIKITRHWLEKEKLDANLKIGSIYEKLPYQDNFFDAIISTSVIHHGKLENIRKAIKEIERVLKPKGLIFITVRRRQFRNWPKFKITEQYDKRQTKYEIVGSRTYLPLNGGEKGMIHYLFNKKLIRKEFKNFQIDKIWVDSKGRHYCFLGELKN